MASGEGGARKSGAPHSPPARHRERAAPPRRGARAAAGRARAGAPADHRPAAVARRPPSGSAGGSRSPARTRARGHRPRRHRSGARPDHRSAQCGRHRALGRRLRGVGHRHHRAPQPGGDRRSGQVRLGRARICAAGDRDQPRPRACGAQGARLPRGRARQLGGGRFRAGGDPFAARSGARCRGQGPAPPHARDLRSGRPPGRARQDQEPQRLERGGAGALSREQAPRRAPDAARLARGAQRQLQSRAPRYLRGGRASPNARPSTS